MRVPKWCGVLRLGAMVAVSAVLALLLFPATGHSEGDRSTTSPQQDTAVPYPKLDSNLRHLVSRHGASAASGSDDASPHPRVMVSVDVSPSEVERVAQWLTSRGVPIRHQGEDFIEVYVPVARLAALSQLFGVTRVETSVSPQIDQSSVTPPGTVVSEGVGLHGADHWHALGLRGEGVKVGILDSGFAGLPELLGTELPGTVTARCYHRTNPGVSSLVGECATGTNHGTHVAQEIIDMAPDVSLYIANPHTLGDLQDAVNWLIGQGVDVVNHSMSWVFDGPGDGTSPKSTSPLNTIDTAVSGGIVWISAAGNSAGKTWYGSYLDTNGNNYHAFYHHNLGGDFEDNTFEVPAGEHVTIMMRWDDKWGGATCDLDLQLVRHIRSYPNLAGPPKIVARSDNPQSGHISHNPYESISYTNNTSATNLHYLKLHRFNCSDSDLPEWIQIMVRGGRGGLRYASGGRHIGGPAESKNEGALAVGAASVDDPNQIEGYSSRGPTAADGRIKPDITAAGCGKVAVGDSVEAACGTSYAAPHVAGMAALVAQRYPAYTPQQIAGYLKAAAQDRGAAGADNTWGHGFAKLPVNVYGLSLSHEELTATEADGAGQVLTYNVRLTEEPATDVTVSIANGASAIADLTPATLKFTTDNWNQNQQVKLTTKAAVDDTIDNDGRSYTLIHSFTTPEFSDDTMRLTVRVTDDEEKPDLFIELSPRTIDEGGKNNTTTVTARLSHATAWEQKITPIVGGLRCDENYRNCRSTLDLSSDNRVLTIPAGSLNSTGTVTYTAVDDEVYTRDNEIFVTFNPRGGYLHLYTHPPRFRYIWGTTLTINDDEPGVPDQIDTLQLSSTSTSSITVKWTQPHPGNSPITSSKVRYRKVGDATWTELSVSGSLTSVDITGLEEDTAYQVQAQAVNKHGSGSWSETKQQTVTSSGGSGSGGSSDSTSTAVSGAVGNTNEPPAQIDAPEQTSSTRTSLTVDWDAPANSGSPITSYSVRYRLADQDPEAPWKLHTHTGTTTITTIADLPVGGATYEVQLRATNDDGSGPWSSSSRVTLKENQAPHIINTRADLFVIYENWQGRFPQPMLPIYEADGDPITWSVGGRDARFVDIGDDGVLSTSQDNPIDFEYLSGLRTPQESTILKIKIIVTDSYGATDSVDRTYRVFDRPEPPAAPDAPTLTAPSATSLTIQWSEPANTGPAITGYSLRYRQTGQTPEAPWTTHPHTGTGRTATITEGLLSGATYEIQVQAANDEGSSSWSNSSQRELADQG